jgi:HAD domain in Swiss Army Knife RNA repair proteins
MGMLDGIHCEAPLPDSGPIEGMMDVLYLDFDGIGHPGDVWYEPASGQVRLSVPGHELFESMPVLEAAIAGYPNLKIVLSTSWLRIFGLEKTRAFLPESLQHRVIGGTYDPQSPDAWRWDRLSRYDTIAQDVERRKPRWLALDDDALGWPKSMLDALVLVPTELGLACPRAQARLRAGLAARFPIAGALAPAFTEGPEEVK